MVFWMRKVFKVHLPIAKTLYTCCIQGDLELVDPAVAKKKEERKHCYCARLLVRNAPPGGLPT